MSRRLQLLWLLFWTFAKIALLVVGGGLAMLPVIEETFVERKKLLTRDELLEVTAIATTIPGIIAANSAVVIGSKLAGFAGAITALFGAVLPSLVIIIVIAALFPGLTPENRFWVGAFAGVRAGVTGMIAVTAWRMVREHSGSIGEVVVWAAVLLLALLRVHPGLLIVGAMIYGILRALLFQHRGKGDL